MKDFINWFLTTDNIRVYLLVVLGALIVYFILYSCTVGLAYKLFCKIKHIKAENEKEFYIAPLYRCFGVVYSFLLGSPILVLLIIRIAVYPK